MEKQSVTTDEEVNVTNIALRVFQNDVVMRTFLRLLPAKDLLNCRLLNGLCNQIACSVLNSIRMQTKRIWTKEGMETFLATFGNRDPLTVLPFTAFELEVWDIPLDLVKSFVELVGSSLVKIKIWFLKNSGYRPPTPSDLDEHQAEAKVIILLTKCSRLEVLDLCDKEFRLRWNRLRDLPKSFPNLRALVSQGFSNLAEGEVNLTVYVARRAPVLDDVKFMRNPGSPEPIPFLSQLPELLYEVCLKPPKLTLHTSFRGYDSSEIFDGMARRNYKRLLSLRFAGTQFHCQQRLNSLYNLLELQSESLENFEINLEPAARYCYGGGPCYLRFPVLTKLKRLSLHLHGAALVHSLESGQFSQLKILEFGCYKRLSFNKWLNETFVVPTLESLTIKRYTDSAENETFHLNFPNLKAFKVSRYDSASLLAYVLSQLTRLEELTMGDCRAPQAAEHGLGVWNIYTGGVIRVSDEVGKLEYKLPSAENSDGAPSLGNFKALKKLHLTTKTGVELEALAYMSHCGKLRGLDDLSIQFACDQPRFCDFKGYDASGDPAKIHPDYKAILDRCHKMVTYLYAFH